MKHPEKESTMPRLAWIAATVLALSCRHNGAGSGGFQDIYPRARAEARMTVSGEVGTLSVTVHATPPFDEDAARRFLLGLDAYRNEVENDYALFRGELARHLGTELLARVDRTSVLQVPEFPIEWYLLGGHWPGATLWSGPRTSSFHVVRPGERLAPQRDRKSVV